MTELRLKLIGQTAEGAPDYHLYAGPMMIGRVQRYPRDHHRAGDYTWSITSLTFGISKVQNSADANTLADVKAAVRRSFDLSVEWARWVSPEAPVRKSLDDQLARTSTGRWED